MTDGLFTECAKVAHDIARCFAVLRAPARLSISQWAAKHARREKGERYTPWPYQREMLDVLNDPRTPKVTIMKSARTGYTQILLSYLGYRIAHDPGNILLTRPTIEDAKKFSKGFIDKVLEWKVMSRLTFGRKVEKTAEDTTLEKYFPGGWLISVGANSPGGFRSHSADVILSDEVDGWPVVAGNEGDQLFLLGRRLEQSHDPRDIAGSTPTDEAVSKIHARFLKSDQRFYHVPCPSCGTMQKLVWGSGKEGEPGLVFEPKDFPETAFYRCENGCAIPESKKDWMLENGAWVATFPQVWEKTGHAGFHVNSLYSLQPNAAWVKIAREFVEARKSPATLKTFINTILGEVWKVQGDAPDWKRLRDRVVDRPAGVVPYGGCFLTCGVDVQAAAGGRLEAYVWAWGRGGSCWLVEHRVIRGSPFEQKVWDELHQFAIGTWAHENGQSLSLERVAVDMGYATQMAYRFARRLGSPKGIPVKGAQDLGALPIANSKAMEIARGKGQSKTKVHVHLVGGHALKQELYARLALERPDEGQPYPLGYVHLPSFADEAMCRQLVAEQWIAEKKEWRQTGPNEALDCWCYARAAAIERGADRWSDAEWAVLESQFAADPAAVAGIPEPEEVPVRQERVEPEPVRAAPRQDPPPRRPSSWLRR